MTDATGFQSITYCVIDLVSRWPCTKSSAYSPSGAFRIRDALSYCFTWEPVRDSILNAIHMRDRDNNISSDIDKLGLEARLKVYNQLVLISAYIKNPDQEIHNAFQLCSMHFGLHATTLHPLAADQRQLIPELACKLISLQPGLKSPKS
jgi:hypothetical protein